MRKRRHISGVSSSSSSGNHTYGEGGEVFKKRKTGSKYHRSNGNSKRKQMDSTSTDSSDMDTYMDLQGVQLMPVRARTESPNPYFEQATPWAAQYTGRNKSVNVLLRTLHFERLHRADMKKGRAQPSNPRTRAFYKPLPHAAPTPSAFFGPGSPSYLRERIKKRRGNVDPLTIDTQPQQQQQQQQGYNQPESNSVLSPASTMYREMESKLSLERQPQKRPQQQQQQHRMVVSPSPTSFHNVPVGIRTSSWSQGFDHET
jgi:hypothetical protein